MRTLSEDSLPSSSTLQINRLWAGEATTVLWRVQPPIRAVAHIEDAEMLQYYADKISSLNIVRDGGARKAHSTLRYLWFLRLSQITITANGYKDERISLQPILRTSKSIGVSILEFRSSWMQGQYPALRSL